MYFCVSFEIIFIKNSLLILRLRMPEICLVQLWIYFVTYFLLFFFSFCISFSRLNLFVIIIWFHPIIVYRSLLIEIFALQVLLLKVIYFSQVVFWLVVVASKLLQATLITIFIHTWDSDSYIKKVQGLWFHIKANVSSFEFLYWLDVKH